MRKRHDWAAPTTRVGSADTSAETSDGRMWSSAAGWSGRTYYCYSFFDATDAGGEGLQMDMTEHCQEHRQ